MDTLEATAEFARLLARLKERSRRSYEDLSHAALTSRSTLHRYCTGKGVPADAETVTRIAKACGADARETHELLEFWMAANRERLDLQPPDSSGLTPPPGAQPPSSVVELAKPTEHKPSGRPQILAAIATVTAVLLALTATASAVIPSEQSRAPHPAQWIAGPSWAMHPRPVRPSLFGVTINSDTGAMPSFTVGAVRFWDSGTRWSNLEPRRGTFDWATLDRLVEGAERRGLDTMFVLGGTPAWAAPQAPAMPYPDGARAAAPDDLSAWDTFVRKLADRYQRRLSAYEVWVNGADSRFFNGSTEQLVEMTRRASAIIKRADPKALVVCPGMGQLWKPSTQRVLRRFAELGGYRYCDASSIKLHQRNPADPPETMLEPLRTVNTVMHQAGVHPPLWSTGTTHELPLHGQLDQEQAVNYAVRYFLTGLYATNLDLKRMYFYNWGSTRIPIVLQGVGGTPTRAALAIERLQRWLADARIHACGQGSAIDLPPNVWQCEFTISGRPAIIRWTHTGNATTSAPPRAGTLQRLDGTSLAVRPGEPIRISGQPVLITSTP